MNLKFFGVRRAVKKNVKERLTKMTNLKYLSFAVPCCMALSGYESGTILALPLTVLILLKVCK